MIGSRPDTPHASPTRAPQHFNSRLERIERDNKRVEEKGGLIAGATRTPHRKERYNGKRNLVTKNLTLDTSHTASASCISRTWHGTHWTLLRPREPREPREP